MWGVNLMRSPILAVTGDTHGEKRRFTNKSGPSFKYLRENDYLFVCGDFGYIFCG